MKQELKQAAFSFVDHSQQETLGSLMLVGSLSMKQNK